MAWEVLNAIGIIAFAVSGAIIAMEEHYDLLGVFVLGLVTAFGGGAIRNLLVDLPISLLWQQQIGFVLALLVCVIVFLLPHIWFTFSKPWAFLDAIGLAVFAVQGAAMAAEKNHTLSAIIVAAVLTGCGGGIVRDVLAARKPLIFRDEIYAVWAMVAGLAVYFGFGNTTLEQYILTIVIVGLRMLSFYKGWRLPRRLADRNNTY
jgi:uncharacterized membrane protein YeiH